MNSMVKWLFFLRVSIVLMSMTPNVNDDEYIADLEFSKAGTLINVCRINAVIFENNIGDISLKGEKHVLNKILSYKSESNSDHFIVYCVENAYFNSKYKKYVFNLIDQNSTQNLAITKSKHM